MSILLYHNIVISLVSVSILFEHDMTKIKKSNSYEFILEYYFHQSHITF